MCQSCTSHSIVQVIRPKHSAQGGEVMLCTGQCRPASACPIKSPHSKGKRQDKAWGTVVINLVTKANIAEHDQTNDSVSLIVWFF